MSKYKLEHPSRTCNRIFDKGGKSYICDHSGVDPDHTDDGPLRFDSVDTKLIRVTDDGFAYVPVHVERAGDRLTRASISIPAAIHLGKKHKIEVAKTITLYHPNHD